MPTIRLNAVRHALDWQMRYDGPDEGERVATVTAITARTITLDLNDEALRDLIADAVYYSEEMSPGNTGDIDYRPAARACLRALERAGVRWTRRPGGFSVTLDHPSDAAPAGQ